MLAKVKDWFKERRRRKAANNAANPAPEALAPVPIPATPPAPVLTPVVAPVPAPLVDQPRAPVRAVAVYGQPDWQPGIVIQRDVEVRMGNVFELVVGPATAKRFGLGWLVYPERALIQLPKLELIYPGTLAAEIENQENEEISEEDEANFYKVLRIKLKCGICLLGAIIVRCPSCFKGLCGDCITDLVKHSHLTPTRCPNCRHQFDQNPFVGLSFARI